MNTEERLEQIETRLKILQATLDAAIRMIATHSPLEAQSLLAVLERDRSKILADAPQ